MSSLTTLKNLTDQLNSLTTEYDKGTPKVTDKEWDEKYFELVNLEKELNYSFPNSPTQKVNYEVVNELKKIEHEHPMLSLQKTKSNEELKAFAAKSPCLLMGKMDGLTCSLTYENGELIRAETRGNGVIGEDVLHNARVITSIPNHINYKEKLVVDGEIICKQDDFIEFQQDFKNPRNFAAGSIRLLDSKECSRRKLTFVVWEVIEGFNNETLLSAKLTLASLLGFTIVPYQHCIGTLDETIHITKEDCIKQYYPIDGLVCKYDNISYGQSLGNTAHHFNNAIAYKFYDEQAVTKLLDIEWGLGRGNELTPVAVFEEIELEGSTVTRASLHNLSILRSFTFPYGPCVNDTIVIEKKNQIIPQVVSWEHNSNSQDEIPEPTVCPVCGEPLSVIISDGGIDNLCCLNSSCEGKLINRLDHFFGKKGLDIKGISTATLEKLNEWNWIDSITSVFENLQVHRAEWIQKPGFGPKSVDNILTAIEEGRKDVELEKFISALGIPLIGENVSKQLAQEFKTYKSFRSCGRNDLIQLSGFAQAKCDAILSFDFSEADYLINNNIVTISESQKTNDNKLQGLTFVITGSLKLHKNRAELVKKIESLGGKVTGSVSKNTNYLICNDKTSTSAKITAAKRLEIPIFSESDLADFLDF